MNWHLEDTTQVLEKLRTQKQGLSASEAQNRLRTYGKNELESKAKKPAWLMFLGQFKDVMIIILLLAAVVSGLIGDLKDTLLIALIVMLNAIIGFLQEYTMTGNAGKIWVIFLAPIVGLPIPLLPIHILWLNLVTDGLPGLALAGEPAEKSVMQRPPRHPQESIFAHGLGWHILWVGLVIGGLVLGLQAWATAHNNSHWQTIVFTSLCFAQIGQILAVRSERHFLYSTGFFTNLPLLDTALLNFLLQITLIYVPFLQEVFVTQALSVSELALCMGVGLVVFHVIEFEKMFKKIFYKKIF